MSELDMPNCDCLCHDVDGGSHGEKDCWCESTELDMSRCPACGSFIDHCQGHGEIGDPYGYRILTQHDDDNHTDCVKYLGQCVGV